MINLNLAVNFRLIFYYGGWVSLMTAGVMLVPVIPALIFQDGQAGHFIWSALIVAACALALIVQGRNQAKGEVRSRDGLATVGLTWLMIGLFGALPFWFSGFYPAFMDGIFESIAGFSATGSTVIADIETLPPSIIFWRALTNWLGGMGVIVLMLAVMPIFGLSGVHLFKNESTLGQQKIKPRFAETAKILWLIYVGFSLALLVLLLLCGLNWFEALCYAMTTIATGGFTSRNLSIGHYNSGLVELVVIAFMIIGSLNFALYYQLVNKGSFKTLWRNTECLFFLGVVFLAGLLLTASLLWSGYYSSPLTALRHGFFQAVSMASTTGFMTADWELWPHFSQGILFALFFMGGCSGSTSSGMKCIRWILLIKGIHRTMLQLIHPRAVIPIRLGQQAVPEHLMTAVWSYGVIYFMVIALSSIALTASGLDLTTAFTVTVGAVGNVGIGLGQLGPTANFGSMPDLAKVILCLDMYLGRLEFFSILVLFLPKFWKK